MNGEELAIGLREYLPLKQGLRLYYLSALAYVSIAPRVSSIKTRIKTLRILHLTDLLSVLREYLPLKQGLRLGNVVFFPIIFSFFTKVPFQNDL